MILKIGTVILILLIMVISYIFYRNNKDKHQKASSSKDKQDSNSYYQEKEDDSFSILSKDSFKDKTIKDFIIEKNIILIEDKCFVNCTNLSNIKVDEENNNYCSKLGVLFTKNMNSLICYPPLKQTSTYFIPQDVQNINTHAFFNNNFIKYVIIPTSVEYIDENSFVNCKFLNQIVIPDTIKGIHPRAFNLCPRLTIRCYKDTITQDYCEKYHIPCEYLSS